MSTPSPLPTLEQVTEVVSNQAVQLEQQRVELERVKQQLDGVLQHVQESRQQQSQLDTKQDLELKQFVEAQNHRDKLQDSENSTWQRQCEEGFRILTDNTKTAFDEQMKLHAQSTKDTILQVENLYKVTGVEFQKLRQDFDATLRKGPVFEEETPTLLEHMKERVARLEREAPPQTVDSTPSYYRDTPAKVIKNLKVEFQPWDDDVDVSVERFFTLLDQHFEYNNVPTHIKQQCIRPLLKGRALLAFDSLPEAATRQYTDVRDHLMREFNSSGRRTKYDLDLQSCKASDFQSFDTFVAAFRTLTLRASHVTDTRRSDLFLHALDTAEYLDAAQRARREYLRRQSKGATYPLSDLIADVSTDLTARRSCGQYRSTKTQSLTPSNLGRSSHTAMSTAPTEVSHHAVSEIQQPSTLSEGMTVDLISDSLRNMQDKLEQSVKDHIRALSSSTASRACAYCEKAGHWWKECHQLEKDRAAGSVRQGWREGDRARSRDRQQRDGPAGRHEGHLRDRSSNGRFLRSRSPGVR